ncbi:MAG: glycoside hydrolase family 88 protein [Bryobacteraceae bacterium]
MKKFILLLLPASLLYGAESLRVLESAVGTTRAGADIRCLITSDDFDYATPKTRVLVVGGGKSTAAAMRWLYESPKAARYRDRFALSAIPDVPVDLSKGFPPTGDAYGGANSETQYIWRWIGMHAPDLAVVIDGGAAGLGDALSHGAPSMTGSIPAVSMAAQENPEQFVVKLVAAAAGKPPSPARLELQRRVARTPLEVATQLGLKYGHSLDEVVYIPAVALIGRIRLGEVKDVQRIVEPYASGAKPTLDKPTSSHFPGHLVFGELAHVTHDPRYVDLVRRAADFAFDQKGNPLEAMPLHNEMSDAVFMGGPILAQAGTLTGDEKYFDMCVRHIEFMLKLNLRPDGLHRHSPLNAAAWGRGNGFPALGIALSLSELPDGHPGFAKLLAAFRAHMEALARHQDPGGAWHEVIDVPGSYRELTATCMIAFAMARGVRLGWLDRAAYDPMIRKAWTAAKSRMAADGKLVDVCTGTGKQKSLQDYLDRTAILGEDPRGGAMGLLLATEMMIYFR